MRTFYFTTVVTVFLLFPRLFSAVADWMSTMLPHIVWSVNLECRLMCAARGSRKMQDAKIMEKTTIWAPSHDFVGLCIRN